MLNPASTTFSGSSQPPAASKSKASALATLIDAITSAASGQPMNGTVNGRRGFQPGNTYGSRRNKGVLDAQKAHTAAKNAATKAVKAHGRSKTDAQRAASLKAVQQATRVAAAAHRTLARARAEHQATKTIAKATPRPKAAPSFAGSVAAHAHAKIDALKRGVVDGTHDNEAINTHIDRIARGTKKDELFEAAKRAGITHDAKTKVDLVNHLKNHVLDHKQAHEEAQVAAAAQIRAKVAPQSQPAPAKPQPAQPAAPTPTTAKPSPSPPHEAKPTGEAVVAAKAHATLISALERNQTRGATDRGNDLRAAVARGNVPRYDRDGLERVAAAHIDAHASREAVPTRPIGRDEPELMHYIDHDGVRYHFTATPEGRSKAVAAFTQLAGAGETIPRHMSQHTTDVYLTTNERQANQRRDTPRPAGYEKHRVAAAANGRAVSIYGPTYRDDRHAVLAHEMSHNFARHLYGSSTPSATSDFEKARRSGEPPVSAYGATAPHEDFATSFEAYFRGKKQFAQSHPERFAVVDRLVKDASYKG